MISSSPEASLKEALLPPPPTKRVAKQLAKTRLCKHYLRGYCRYEDRCAYAHAEQELMPRPNLVKTKLCASFLQGGCTNPDCSYAHGWSELRPITSSQTSEQQENSQSLDSEGHPGMIELSSGHFVPIGVLEQQPQMQQHHQQRPQHLLHQQHQQQQQQSRHFQQEEHEQHQQQLHQPQQLQRQVMQLHHPQQLQTSVIHQHGQQQQQQQQIQQQ